MNKLSDNSRIAILYGPCSSGKSFLLWRFLTGCVWRRVTRSTVIHLCIGMAITIKQLRMVISS